MRLALISDIHSNLPALEAAMADVDRAQQRIREEELPSSLGRRLERGN